MHKNWLEDTPNHHKEKKNNTHNIKSPHQKLSVSRKIVHPIELNSCISVEFKIRHEFLKATVCFHMQGGHGHGYCLL